MADFIGRRVLEVGCGDGRLTWQYAPSTGQAVGIDLVPERLIAAQQDRPTGLVSRVMFVLADSLALPFHSASFDIAILAWSF